MKLGLLTAPFEDTPLLDVAHWAGSHGYSMLEVACWPASKVEQRRYAGTSHIDVDSLSETSSAQLVKDLAERGIEISGLGYYPNNLHADPESREMFNEHTKKVIAGAAILGVPVVNTFIGADPAKSQADNYKDFLDSWGGILDFAREKGVKIAIENCPMIFSMDEWPGGKNLAYSPKIWRQMFADTAGDVLGLNLDPSHLIWQMIDVERVVDEFVDRIYHVHIKDLEINREGLYENGILSMGMGWQVPRLPGLGEVNWPRFISALYRNNYDYVLCVEHEDRNFEGTDELVKKGFEIARNVIAPLVP